MPTYDEFETGYGVWDLSGNFSRVIEGGGIYEKTMDSAHSLAEAGCPIRCIKRH
jgi:hypothetical protein